VSQDEISRLLDEPTMSVDDAATVLGVSRDAVYDAVARGEILSVRVGRLIRVASQPLREQLGL
jgi:excisionase family DNA binding protein